MGKMNASANADHGRSPGVVSGPVSKTPMASSFHAETHAVQRKTSTVVSGSWSAWKRVGSHAMYDAHNNVMETVVAFDRALLCLMVYATVLMSSNVRIRLANRWG